MYVTSFSLDPIQPFRLDLTVWALRRRAKNRIDNWDGQTYSRVLVIDNTAIKIDVSYTDQLNVKAYHDKPIDKIEDLVSKKVTRILGLDVDLQPFYAIAETNEYLYPLVKEFKGVKPPRFPTIFEGLGNAVACQQVSLEAGLSVLNRLAESFGKPFRQEEEIAYSFPDPEAIFNRDIEELRQLGFSYNKSAALLGIATDMTEHRDFYSNMETTSRDDVFIHLSELKGIGRWSVEYAMLRGLGRIDILPGDDIAVTKSLQNILKLEEIPNYHKMKELEASLYPYGGMIYFHLVLKKLVEKGVIQG